MLYEVITAGDGQQPRVTEDRLVRGAGRGIPLVGRLDVGGEQPPHLGQGLGEPADDVLGVPHAP